MDKSDIRLLLVFAMVMEEKFKRHGRIDDRLQQQVISLLITIGEEKKPIVPATQIDEFPFHTVAEKAYIECPTSSFLLFKNGVCVAETGLVSFKDREQVFWRDVCGVSFRERTSFCDLGQSRWSGTNMTGGHYHLRSQSIGQIIRLYSPSPNVQCIEILDPKTSPKSLDSHHSKETELRQLRQLQLRIPIIFLSLPKIIVN